MSNNLVPVKCEDCKYYSENQYYKYEGYCILDDEYTRGSRSCDKLKTDKAKRKARIKG